MMHQGRSRRRVIGRTNLKEQIDNAKGGWALDPCRPRTPARAACWKERDGRCIRCLSWCDADVI